MNDRSYKKHTLHLQIPLIKWNSKWSHFQLYLKEQNKGANMWPNNISHWKRENIIPNIIVIYKIVTLFVFHNVIHNH